MVRLLATDAPLLAANADDAETLADMAKGEEMAVLDITGLWAWGYRRRDHMVGYVAADALAPHD